MNKIDFVNAPLKQLLWKLAVPMMVAFLVQALYNTVDAIYVGQYAGNDGVAALGVSFPLQLMLGTISTMFAAGGASLISIAMGKGRHDEARKIVTIQFIWGMFFTLVFTLLSYVYLEDLMRFFGASDQVVLNYSVEYMWIVLAGSLLVGYSTLVSFVLRSQGRSKGSMLIMLIGALTNIILDPIFVFGLNMGITGAAYATVIAQVASVLIAIYYQHFTFHDLKFTIVGISDLIKRGMRIAMLGLASFVSTSMFSMILIVSNRILSDYGTKADLALFSSIIKLTQLLILPIFGLVAGMQPIVGFNYGAKNYSRVKETYRLTIKYVAIIMVTGTLIVLLFPEQIMNIFTKDPVTNLMAIRLSFVGFVGAGIVNASFSYLQSLNMKWTALILSFLRQVIIYIPLALILAPFLKTYAVWLSQPISDLTSMVIAVTVVFAAEKRHLDQKNG